MARQELEDEDSRGEFAPVTKSLCGSVSEAVRTIHILDFYRECGTSVSAGVVSGRAS